MHLEVVHTTRYQYSQPAWSNINELRLSPEETKRQSPGEVSIKVHPSPGNEPKTSRDMFGNLVHLFEIEEMHSELEITSQSSVETRSNPDLVERAHDVPLAALAAAEESDPFVHDFLSNSTFIPRDPEVWREAIDAKENAETQSVGSVVEQLSNHIFESCYYDDSQLISGQHTSSDVRQTRKGACQEFAHLLIGYCRELGIPARYISGYLFDPGLSRAEPEFVGAQLSHAWVEVYIQDALGNEWLGIDPTNRKWVDEQYVSVALGRDYFDVAPVKGTLIGGGKRRSLDVKLEVRQV
ncbi:MAG: transglutaminase family protein [Verrucomicrobiota bacterium]